MKIQLITIEGEPDEIESILDFKLDEYVKVSEVREGKVIGHIGNADIELKAIGKKLAEQNKENIEIGRPATQTTPEPKAEPEKHVKDKRDKYCADCSAPFRDESKTNTRKWCDKCTCLNHVIDNKYVRKPRPTTRYPKPDLTRNEVIKPPAHNRAPIVLKANEKLCHNPYCKRKFIPERLEDFCPDCMAKPNMRRQDKLLINTFMDFPAL
jgi:hypothetical protein